jgi:hypothetical protein
LIKRGTFYGVDTDTRMIENALAWLDGSIRKKKKEVKL